MTACDRHQRAVARWGRVVGGILRPHDDVAGIVGDEEITAVSFIPVVAVEQRDPILRLPEVAVIARRFVEGESGAAPKLGDGKKPPK